MKTIAISDELHRVLWERSLKTGIRLKFIVESAIKDFLATPKTIKKPKA